MSDGSTSSRSHADSSLLRADALKVALGATIYTVFLLAPTLQDSLFIKYGMTSSLITVIVAIAPTMYVELQRAELPH